MENFNSISKNIKSLIVVLSLVVVFVGFFGFAKKPSYAYFNILGQEIPSNFQELKETVITKIFVNKSIFKSTDPSSEQETNNQLQNILQSIIAGNNGQATKDQSATQSNNNNGQNNLSDQSDSQLSDQSNGTNSYNNSQNSNSQNNSDNNINYIDIEESQINDLATAFLQNKNYNNIKAQDVKVMISQGVIDFEVLLENGETLTGKILVSANGQNLTLQELNSSVKRKLPAFELMIAKSVFNKYANKDFISNVSPEYADKFSHIEALDGKIRLHLK